jgi:hypothetical protein
VLAFGLAGTPALTAFFYLATSGALSLLVVYVLVSVNALRLQKCWVGAKPLSRRYCSSVERRRQGTYVRNLTPAPANPYSLFPYLVAGWLVLGLMVAAAVPSCVSKDWRFADGEYRAVAGAPDAEPTAFWVRASRPRQAGAGRRPTWTPPDERPLWA